MRKKTQPSATESRRDDPKATLLGVARTRLSAKVVSHGRARSGARSLSGMAAGDQEGFRADESPTSGKSAGRAVHSYDTGQFELADLGHLT